jgi:DNA-binding transcriptional MerR regulator
MYMDEERRIHKTSEVARELGISAEWLTVGERRRYFPPARRDPTNSHRYYTRGDVKRPKARRARKTGDGR